MKKFFGNKAVKIILSVITIILTVVAVCNAVFASTALKTQHGTAVCDPWSSEDSFKMEDTVQLDMGDEDYKVLCLTDIHIRNHGTFGAAFGTNIVLDTASRIQLKKMINREQPDLIVIGGDTVLTEWNDIELQNFADFMDGFEIPWAHVYGNHDMEGRADKSRLSEILLNSEHGLFQSGPDGMDGMGNYILNLQRDGSTVYSLFMLDNGEYRITDGKITDGGVSPRQSEWYRWATNGIQQANGAPVPSMAFMHVAVPEYKEITDGYQMGQRGEDSFTAQVNDGFFDVFKEAGGTHMFAGHDHNNNFITDYEGVTLGYLTKSSYNCYFTSKALGAVVINFDQANQPNLSIIKF